MLLLLTERGGSKRMKSKHKKSQRRKKGTGSLRYRVDEGRWEARYKDSSGRIKSLYNTDKEALERELEKRTYIVNTTLYGDVGEDVELKIWFEHYISIKEFQVQQRSLNQIKLAYYNYMDPVIGKKPMYKINQNDIIAVVKYVQSKNLKSSTQDNIYRHMRAMFNFAFQEGMFRRNPMITIRLEHQQKTTRDILQPDEIKNILEEAYNHDIKFHDMLCTLLYTGIRAGELCGLKWKNFDADFTYMSIDESITDKRFENSTKTMTSMRDIPLNNFLSEMFKRRYEQVKDMPDILNQYVFLNKFGTSYTTCTVNTRLNFLKELIHQKYGLDYSHITPHCFRHTFATIGMQNGVDMKEMQELLGHARCDTLLNTYTHSNILRKKASVNTIHDVLQSLSGHQEVYQQS